MKKFLKIFGGIVLALILIVGAGLIYFFTSFPKVGTAPNLTIDATPEKIERSRTTWPSASIAIPAAISIITPGRSFPALKAREEWK